MNNKYIIAILALVLGIILIIAGFAIVGGNFSAFNSKKGSKDIEMNYVASGKITELEVSERSESIKITRGNVDNVTVKYFVPDDQEDELKITEGGSKLKLERQDRKLSFTVMINVTFTDTTTVITLPKDYKGDITLKTTSGSIRVSDIENEGDFVASANSGSVHIEEVECKAMSATTHSGSVNLDDVECTDLLASASSGSVKLKSIKASGDVNASTTSGSVKVEGLKGKAVTLKANSGSVNFDNVECDSMDARATSGSIRFDDLEADNIYLKNNSGGIHGTIDGKEEDYAIISSNNSGSNNLHDKKDGSKNLEAHTTSGSIRISFK